MTYLLSTEDGIEREDFMLFFSLPSIWYQLILIILLLSTEDNIVREDFILS